MKRLAVALTFVASTATAAEPEVVVPAFPVRAAPPPTPVYAYKSPELVPTAEWALTQLIPSPEVAFGRQREIDVAGNVEKGIHPAFGLRWQLTPVLWSFGVHRRQSRWRSFIVDPIARQSGSIELSQTFEYVGGHIDRVLVRPGLRVYLPLSHRGEYVSTSLGTSVYRFDGDLRVAYDVGIYFLSGFFGFQATVAPTHDPLAAIATFRIRNF